MLFRDALAHGAKQLKTHRCDSADALLESEALLCFSAGFSREKLFMVFDQPVPARAFGKFEKLLARRAAHTPLAWLLGNAFFLGREFLVSEATLIPRPATEYVVEAALAAARAEDAAPGRAVREMVDVGTGSGCIAVSLALAFPTAVVWATDSSIAALAMTRRNARKHSVYSVKPRGGNVSIRKCNLIGYQPTPGHASTHPVPLSGEGTVLLVANLPYLPTGMRTTMAKCVLREPASALFSGKDGLDASRALLVQIAALRNAKPNKHVVLAYEILPKQFVSLSAAVRRAFPGTTPERIKNAQGVTVGLLVRIDAAQHTAPHAAPRKRAK